MTGSSRRDIERPVKLTTGEINLEGTIYLPEEACGLVIFAHGSGSNRLSPRNTFVSNVLQHAGLGTLLIDLLTLDEDEEDRITGEYRFDISLLAARLEFATEWVRQLPNCRGLKLGYFGASTGAAAALVAAAKLNDEIDAVVSRGGRPDLASRSIPLVQAPTLLVVGGKDTAVLDLNRWALEHLNCIKQIEIIPGATHLFEEPGTLEGVAGLARHWFERYLIPAHNQTFYMPGISEEH